jgi:hypothetical protein
MAVVQADITAALATLFEDVLATQWNRAVVFSKLIPCKGSYGQNINWDIRDVDGSTAAGSSMVAEGAASPAATDDAVEKATLEFCNYADSFAVSGKALNAARATGNPNQLADLFGEKLMECVSRLAKNLNSEWFLGTGASNHIAGLCDPTNGALKASGTYAGVDKAAKTLFQGNELLNGGMLRPLSIQLMRDAMRAIYTASGEMPDLIVTDPIQFARYGMLFGEQRRYLDNMSTSAGTFKLDGGFKALEFDGIPIVQDKDAPASKVLFLNTNRVCIRQLNDTLVNASLGGQNTGAMIRLAGTPETQMGAGTTGLTARLIPLAVAGDSYQFELIIYPQIQVTRPNACAMLGDLVSA